MYGSITNVFIAEQPQIVTKKTLRNLDWTEGYFVPEGSKDPEGYVNPVDYVCFSNYTAQTENLLYSVFENNSLVNDQ